MIIKKVSVDYLDDLSAEVKVVATPSSECEIGALVNSINSDIDICGTCDQNCNNCNSVLEEPKFGGAYYTYSGELVYIEKVIYNKPTVVVVWSDGEKTRSTCMDTDSWNSDLGLMNCIIKKLNGQEFVNKIYRDWAMEAKSDKATFITLKDVRKKNKCLESNTQRIGAQK